MVSSTQLIQELTNPPASATIIHNLRDSAGNPMQVPSFIELNQPNAKYAAVYHVPVAGTNEFSVDLATSNDLTHWTFDRTLFTDASMATIQQVPGTAWIVVAHENDLFSQGMQNVQFNLFYSAADLLAGTVAAIVNMPKFYSNYNGTPNIYSLEAVNQNGCWGVDACIGFHYASATNAQGQITQDLTGISIGTNLFNPEVPVHFNTVSNTMYNDAALDLGAQDIGLRTAVHVSDGLLVFQEVATASPLSPDYWSSWHIVADLADTSNSGSWDYPTGQGHAELLPVPLLGNTSIGAPTITVLDSPDGDGQVCVFTDFAFSQGQGPAGTTLDMWGLGPEPFSADSASATVYSDEYDVAPDPVELGVLDGFTARQFAYGQQIGVMDPEVYAYQALGEALASTASHFQNTFGPSNPTDPNSVSGDAVFVSNAYANVFGHPGSPAQVQHFVDQMQFFDGLYTTAGTFGTATEIDLLARGAIYGQMLGAEAELQQARS